MAGKGILILVLGFIAVMGRFGIERNRVITRSVEKMANYYDETNAYNIAVAGANIAFARLNLAANVFNPIPDSIAMNNISFNGGTFSVSTIKITGTGNSRLTSTGTFRNSISSVIVTFQPGNFGNYAYFSENESANPNSVIWWYGADSVFGPFHTQGNLNCSDHPYFGGDVTIKGTVKYENNNYNANYPIFNKNFTANVNRPMPSDGLNKPKDAAYDAGKVFTGKDTVYLTFAGTNVKYRFSWKGTETTTPISTLAPNGVILVETGIVRLKGQINGSVTVIANDVQNGSKGDIYLDDDITLSGNPRTNSNCDDFLGIVAANDVIITDNTYNNNNINIDAAIYCQWGGFSAQNHTGRGKDGAIRICGGIVQRTRGPVGTKDGNGISSGFSKSYHYDQRFADEWPPFYPCGRNFRIVSWYDGPSKTN